MKKINERMKELVEKLVKLLELKSLVTLILTALITFVVVYQTVRNGFTFSPEFVGGIIMAVFTYYFNRTKKDTSVK